METARESRHVHGYRSRSLGKKSRGRPRASNDSVWVTCYVRWGSRSATRGSHGRRTPVTIENPLYVAVTFAVGIAGFVLGGLLSLLPLVGPVLSSVVVAPALAATLLGMAVAARGGQASIDDARAALSSCYLHLAGAYLIVQVAVLVFAVVTVASTFVLGVGVLSLADPGTNPSAATGWTIALLLLFLALAVVALGSLLVIQFLDVAVVVGGESTTAAFAASWALCRDESLSVLGYTVLRTAFGGLILVVPLALAGLLFAFSMGRAYLRASHAAYFEARTAAV